MIFRCLLLGALLLAGTQCTSRLDVGGAREPAERVDKRDLGAPRATVAPSASDDGLRSHLASAAATNRDERHDDAHDVHHHRLSDLITQEDINDSNARLLDAEPTADIVAYGCLMTLPITGSESSNFGLRDDPFRRRSKRLKLHKGIDFKAARGTRVAAAGAGIVRVARRYGSYGRLVIIDHGDGVETRYAHLQRIEVRRGDRVLAGTVVGTVGSSGRSTGPHLHFEVRERDRAIDPVLALAHGLAVRNGTLIALTESWATWLRAAVVVPAGAAFAATAAAPPQSTRLPSFQR